MKLIISLLFFILLSCEQISKDEVLIKNDNTKKIIEEKANNKIKETKELTKKVKENNKIEDKKEIFYLKLHLLKFAHRKVR